MDQDYQTTELHLSGKKEFLLCFCFSSIWAQDTGKSESFLWTVLPERSSPCSGANSKHLLHRLKSACVQNKASQRPGGIKAGKKESPEVLRLLGSEVLAPLTIHSGIWATPSITAIIFPFLLKVIWIVLFPHVSKIILSNFRISFLKVLEVYHYCTKFFFPEFFWLV